MFLVCKNGIVKVVDYQSEQRPLWECKVRSPRMLVLEISPFHAIMAADFAFSRDKFYDKNSRDLSQELIARPELLRVPVVRIVRRSLQSLSVLR